MKGPPREWSHWVRLLLRISLSWVNLHTEFELIILTRNGNLCRKIHKIVWIFRFINNSKKFWNKRRRSAFLQNCSTEELREVEKISCLHSKTDGGIILGSPTKCRMRTTPTICHILRIHLQKEVLVNLSEMMWRVSGATWCVGWIHCFYWKCSFLILKTKLKNVPSQNII